METVTFVLMLLAMASAHPYSPYTDHKGDAKNVQLSEEAVAAYLNSKMDEENLEPAKIMDYVEALLQKKAPPTETPKDVPCVTGPGGTSDSLMSSQLEMILNTLYPVTTSSRPHATIITPDRGTNMYIHELDKPIMAYTSMLDYITTTEHIWANYSPCPSCARALLSHYNKPEDNKPTIHVARIYTESDDLSDVVQSLQCLAKLKHKGFDIEPWNFNEFKATDGVPIFADTCISAITAAYGESNFTSTYMELERYVRFIRQLGDSSHANSWCSEV